MDPLADYSAMVEATCSTNYSLLAVNASIQGTHALLEKDIITPNQKTWPETAVWMGIKPPRMQKCLPEERGVTAKSIGVAKSKKQKHTEPYGEQAKHAKPDAMSAKVNEHAHEHALSPASNVAVFLLVPPSASVLPTPAFPSAPPTFNFGSTSLVPSFLLIPAFPGALIFHFRSTPTGSVPPHINALHVMKM
jgi:hypothetical protein